MKSVVLSWIFNTIIDELQDIFKKHNIDARQI
jgi:hypothetical protein